MATTTFPQRRSFWRSPWLIAAAAAAILALIAGLSLSTRNSSATTLPATSLVERGDLVASVSGSGSIAALQTLDLTFEASGRVAEVLVEAGTSVEAGQELARIDDRTLRSQVATAEANLRSAQAQLEQTRAGNATPEELAASEASVANAVAQLEQTRSGNVTAGDIAQAEANLRSAQAQLDELLAGPRPDELSSAQLNVEETRSELQRLQASLQETRDSLSKAKTDAEIAVNQAAIDLQTAQSEYSTAYWTYQNVQDKGRQPSENEQQTNPELSDYGNLTAYETFKQAELKLANAEETLRKAQVDLEHAQAAERTGTQQAEQQVLSAEARLRDAEVQLTATQTGATATEIAEARANVDAARASLQQVQEGGTPAQVAAAQASVDQARAQLAQLTSSATASDLEIQQATVVVREQELAQARLELENAVLRAPFAGIVTTVEIVPGSIAGSGVAAMSLVDRSTLRVDLTLSENDVAQVALGQPVTLTVDALRDWAGEGVVRYIAPTGQENNGVVTYAVRVSFPDDDARVKVGMTANVQIVTAEQQNALLVPNSALLPKGAGQAVQMLNADGTTREVEVTTGLSDGVQTEILSGLNEGERVVTTPASTSSGQRRGPFGF